MTARERRAGPAAAAPQASDATTWLRISVVLALPDVAHSVELCMRKGSTVEDAVAQSGLSQRYPGVPVGGLACGIWGRVVQPFSELVDGDRVELYRPLTADPKRDRRHRARIRRPHPNVIEKP